MFKHTSFAALLLAASLSSAFAGNYYGAISYVDSEIDDLDANGVSLTVGRNVDYGVLTAIQFTYADLGDNNFLDDDDNSLNADASSIELAAILSVDYGQFTPFVSLGYENTDIDIRDNASGNSVTIDDDGFFYSVGVDYALNDALGLRLEMTYDEFTDDEGEDLDIETVRFGVVRQF
jgi:opacity protein-like surface antigen